MRKEPYSQIHPAPTVRFVAQGGMLEYVKGDTPKQLHASIPKDLKLVVSNSGIYHNTGEMVERGQTLGTEAP